MKHQANGKNSSATANDCIAWIDLVISVHYMKGCRDN